MKAPEKIYMTPSYEEPDNVLLASFSKSHLDCHRDIEYICKDAILEWAEKKKNDVKKFGQRYNEANYYNSGCHDTIQELIDKINEL